MNYTLRDGRFLMCKLCFLFLSFIKQSYFLNFPLFATAVAKREKLSSRTTQNYSESARVLEITLTFNPACNKYKKELLFAVANKSSGKYLFIISLNFFNPKILNKNIKLVWGWQKEKPLM